MADPQASARDNEPELSKTVLENLGKAISSSVRVSTIPDKPRVSFTLVREIGRELQPPPTQPLAVALDPARRIYVLDRPAPGRFRLACFAPTGEPKGKPVEFAKGSADEELLDAASLAVDAQQQVYLVDAQAGCVKKFSADGRWLASFSSAGFDGSLFNNPRDVALDEAGSLYVADTNNNRIVKLSPDGELGWVLERFTNSAGGQDNDELYEPCSVCVGSGQRLCVTDTNQNRVLTFDAKRRLVSALAMDGMFVFPSGVRLSADGQRLYVADHGNLRVQRFAPKKGTGPLDSKVLSPFSERTGTLALTERLTEHGAVAGGGAMAVDAEGRLVMVHPLREAVYLLAFVEA